MAVIWIQFRGGGDGGGGGSSWLLSAGDVAAKRPPDKSRRPLRPLLAPCEASEPHRTPVNRRNKVSSPARISGTSSLDL